MDGGPLFDFVDLELELIRFYHRLILGEIQWSTESNTNCLLAVKNAYCKSSIQNQLSDIRFGSPGMRCAYIFLNTPCYSSTTAFHFLGLLRVNPWFLQRTLSRGVLSICCLGGGPAPELVAIVKTLEFVLKFCGLRPSLTICATVVDIDPGWENTVRWMTQNWWRHFDTSIVKLRVKFVRADLTQPLTEEVRAAVASSDVVTMVKFLSSVYGTKSRDRIPDMLQEITDRMSIGGVLFYMNCSRFYCDEALSKVMPSNGHMGLIYTVRDHVYRLSGPAFEECFRFYFRYYAWNTPTPENNSYVSAWCKRKQREVPQ